MRLPCPAGTRESRSHNSYVNLTKTLAQIAVFWSLFLWLVPMAIVHVESRLGTPTLSSPITRVAGILLFAVMGAIGLYCGLIFAVLGDGTPLPLDTTTKLVIVGPYRYVRNPMAITGITQGFAVGLYAGSPGTIVYSFLGYFAWNFLARGWEEADLERRFGAEYVRYRAAVRCWIPRLTPYERIAPMRKLNSP